MATEQNLQITTFEQLATLLTQVAQNNTNLSLTYYNMFYNTTPQDITLKLYDSNGVLQTYTVPNRAKDFNYIKNGSGSPQGVITANVGTLYQDITNGVLYIKSIGTDAQGWIQIGSEDYLKVGVDNPNGTIVAPKGTLYINTTTSTLYIKSTSTGSDGWIQVNANLSNMANVDLSNISSTAQGNIRNAITGGASSITSNNLAADKVLVSDGYGKVAVSTASTSNLELLGDITATAAEINILDGATITTAELNVLDGVTASTAELNILDGVTATTAELNYVDGTTSNIQTQLNNKIDTSTLNEFVPLIATYVDGSSGCNIWANGYCEQWGETPISNGSVITFVKSFLNTNYNVLINGAVPTTGYAFIHCVKTTSSSITVSSHTSGGGSYSTTVYWKASGYLAAGEYQNV